MSGKLWLPGAERLTPSKPGGIMVPTGGPRCTWHTTESGTGNDAFAGNVAWLRKQSTESHLLWDPTTGRIGQFFPANRSARTLGNWGAIRTNRSGRVHIQIEVLGKAHLHPLLDGPMRGLDDILEWLDGWGIPRAWPAGLPYPSPHPRGKKPNRPGTIWLRNSGGYFAHSQVPGNTHTDPGLVDPKKFQKKVVEKENKPVSVLKRGAFIGWFNSYSGKPPGVQRVPVDGKWRDVVGVKVDAATISGEEKHVLYLRGRAKWKLGTTGLWCEVRWVRDGGTPTKPTDDDPTGHTPLYVPRHIDSFPFPALHLESGEKGVGGKWQVKFVGGASYVDLSTRYAKTHVIAPLSE